MSCGLETTGGGCGRGRAGAFRWNGVFELVKGKGKDGKGLEWQNFSFLLDWALCHLQYTKN